MSKKLIWLACFALLVSIAGDASADLVVHWRLDEGSGTTAFDSSGNGYDGTFVGTPEWVDGHNSAGALHFTAEGQIVLYSFDDAVEWPAGTVAVWVKADTVGQGNWQGVFSSHVPNSAGFQMDTDDGDPGNYRFQPGGILFGTVTTEWIHLAVAWDGTSLNTYYNGVSANSGTVSATNTTFNQFAMAINRNAANTLMGTFDDLRVYDHALTEMDILSAMTGEPWPYAYGPDPADGALRESTWINLSWKPGDLAVSHDVYLGDNFDDVNDATRDSDVFRGNQGTTFYVAGFPGFAFPEGLVPGTTYYWRIDEVNDANPDSPWKGDVWSFTVPPKKAYDPDPADAAKFIDPNVTLSWTPGMGAKLHTVYFGDSFDNVNGAVVGVPQPDTTYTPGTLELDTVYYWRVDEFDGITTHKGNIWSFATRPFIAITDPDLAGWWTFEEGSGRVALDWSGHGHDVTFRNNPEWVEGYDGGALMFDGVDDAVVSSFDEETWSAYTVALWAKAGTVGQNEWSSVFSNHVPNSAGFQLGVDGANPGVYRYNGVNGGVVEIGTVTTSWGHIGVTCNGTSTTLYFNGDVVATIAAADAVFNKFGIGINRGEDNFFEGIIDEVRVYSKELTQAELQLAMRGDPLLAWAPRPASGSSPDIDAALPLNWSAGDNASQHDVYFGTDRDAVNNADDSDTTGVYRGRQSATTYTPPEGVEWGGGPYFWRIDEVNTDGTISRGKIWSFTVVDFILVDDFESYTDDDVAGEAIWQAWIDGFGVPSNGAQVGYLLPPYAEQTIVNSGGQSMPLLYDNTAGVTNSEAVLTLTAPRDWTRHGLANLSLWFRGYPASTGSFTEGPVGTYTMTGSGADIWGTADQFHFAFKTLTGAGTIIARVNSVQNTHTWAKAGVMIRETLDADSKHAFACVSPGNGVAFQGRTGTDSDSFSTNQADITAPQWVKLERDAAGNFSVSHSTNGTSWQSVGNAVPTNIPMTSNVHIGLALTSHDAAQTCEAVLSNISTTGAVSGQWTHQDVGIASNAAEPMYVALSNATGASAVVVHDDPAAATLDTWTQWVIPLQAFADQGVNLADVDKIAMGLGTKAGIAAPGGPGTMYFDDIRLYQTAPEPQP